MATASFSFFGLSQRPVMAMAATVGAVAVGAALIEAALIPGLLLGGVVVMAPRLMAGRPKNRARPVGAKRAAESSISELLASLPRRLELKQATVKTITFRVVVTAIDFSVNYIVLGDVATAAGLSGLTLVVGPMFYFLHEASWSYFGPRLLREDAARGVVIAIAPKAARGERSFVISKALAKTITYRTIATVTDFSVNYLVVGDLAIAALLSSFGFVFGPFIYFGHERAWEIYNARRAGNGDDAKDVTPAAPLLLGAPA